MNPQGTTTLGGHPYTRKALSLTPATSETVTTPKLYAQSKVIRLSLPTRTTSGENLRLFPDQKQISARAKTLTLTQKEQLSEPDLLKLTQPSVVTQPSLIPLVEGSQQNSVH